MLFHHSACLKQCINDAANRFDSATVSEGVYVFLAFYNAQTAQQISAYYLSPTTDDRKWKRIVYFLAI